MVARLVHQVMIMMLLNRNMEPMMIILVTTPTALRFRQSCICGGTDTTMP